MDTLQMMILEEETLLPNVKRINDNVDYITNRVFQHRRK